MSTSRNANTKPFAFVFEFLVFGVFLEESKSNYLQVSENKRVSKKKD